MWKARGSGGADLEREARQKVMELENRIKALEQRMDSQYHETEEIKKRLGAVERSSQSATTN